MRKTRTTTFLTTAALLTLTLATAACTGSNGTTLSEADADACTTLVGLSDDDGAVDKWEAVYQQFAASDSADLREVAGQVLNAGVNAVHELNPLRDRTLRICTAAGWTAPTAGQGD